jgi:hypothetical protein
MKRFVLAILSLVSSTFGALGQENRSDQDISRSVPASAQIDNTAVKETLINLEKQSWEAWKKRDGKFFQGISL